LGLTGIIAAFGQGDQPLRLPANSHSLGACRTNALMLKQLLDQIAPQSLSLVFLST
jgi:hypothetical protein